MRDPDETELDPVEVLTEAEAWAPDAQEGVPAKPILVRGEVEPPGPTATLGEDGLELDPNQAPE